MSFNWVDLVILGIVVISSLISLSRGFVKEALSLVIWIFAGVVAWMFGGSLAHHLQPYIDIPSVRTIPACALLFVVTLLVGGLINFLLAQLIRATGLTGTDRLLGMHVVSAGAGDIVHQGMIAMEFVSSIEDLQLMTFAHPTISEAVHEAVLSADGRAIHAIQRKRK